MTEKENTLLKLQLSEYNQFIESEIKHKRITPKKHDIYDCMRGVHNLKKITSEVSRCPMCDYSEDSLGQLTPPIFTF